MANNKKYLSITVDSYKNIVWSRNIWRGTFITIIYRNTYEEVPFKRRSAIQTPILRFICRTSCTDYTTTKDKKIRRTASTKKKPSLHNIVRFGKQKIVHGGGDRNDAMEGTGSLR